MAKKKIYSENGFKIEEEVILKSSKFFSRRFKISKNQDFFYFNGVNDTKIYGTLIKNGNKLIIFSCGSLGTIEKSKRWFNPIADLGYSLFTYDLRGRGKSKGSILDFGNQILDLEYAIPKAISEMKKLNKPYPSEIILVGHSLGAVATLCVGSKSKDVSKIFAISPLYSIEDLVKNSRETDGENIWENLKNKTKEILDETYYYRKFIKYLYNKKGKYRKDLIPKYVLTKELMKKIYIIHGKKDKYFPFEKTSQIIIDKFNLKRSGRCLIVENGGHSFTDAQLRRITRWIDNKIKEKS